MGYDLNFVLPDRNITVNKGSRELFHVIDTESIDSLNAVVQVRQLQPSTHSNFFIFNSLCDVYISVDQFMIELIDYSILYNFVSYYIIIILICSSSLLVGSFLYCPT